MYQASEQITEREKKRQKYNQYPPGFKTLTWIQRQSDCTLRTKEKSLLKVNSLGASTKCGQVRDFTNSIRAKSSVFQLYNILNNVINGFKSILEGHSCLFVLMDVFIKEQLWSAKCNQVQDFTKLDLSYKFGFLVVQCYNCE